MHASKTVTFDTLVKRPLSIPKTCIHFFLYNSFFPDIRGIQARGVERNGIRLPNDWLEPGPELELELEPDADPGEGDEASL